MKIIRTVLCRIAYRSCVHTYEQFLYMAGRLGFFVFLSPFLNWSMFAYVRVSFVCISVHFSRVFPCFLVNLVVIASAVDCLYSLISV